MPRRHAPTLESPQEFSRLLERAQKLAPQLGAATDELNNSITRYERALASLHLGVSARIEIGRDPILGPNDEESGEHHIEQVRFSKADGTWRLRYESGPDDGPEHWDSVPLVSAPREVRVRAVEFLPRLLEEMIDTAENATAKVTEKAKQLDTITALIKPLKNSEAE